MTHELLGTAWWDQGAGFLAAHAIRYVALAAVVAGLTRWAIWRRARRPDGAAQPERTAVFGIELTVWARYLVMGFILGATWVWHENESPWIHALRVVIVVVLVAPVIRWVRQRYAKHPGRGRGARVRLRGWLLAKLVLVVTALGIELLLEKWLSLSAAAEIAALWLGVTVAVAGPLLHERLMAGWRRACRVAPASPAAPAIIAKGLLALALGLAVCGSSGPTEAETTTTVSPPTSAAASAGITSVPVRVIQTTDGRVAYRQLGKGTPLLLIMGLGGSIDDWAPSLVNALASRYRVIVFNNAGVGGTSPLPSPLTVSAMAEQTSAFISALGLDRVDVFGWSMGGMIAQALTVRHPHHVHRLVLAATQAGTGRALPVPAAAAADATSAKPADVLSTLFPPGQSVAEQKYVTGILGYPGYYGAPRDLLASQNAAIEAWLKGNDPSGHLVGAIRVPALVADGTIDALDPTANDRMLSAAIPRAQLVLYPGAGHGFMFQDAASFIPRLEKFFK
jgi:pimeloyl-ACP methyl ester carboxylesterase